MRRTMQFCVLLGAVGTLLSVQSAQATAIIAGGTMAIQTTGAGYTFDTGVALTSNLTVDVGQMEYLLVGGGGAGGNGASTGANSYGDGGAGGGRTTGLYTTDLTSYAVTVGGGSAASGAIGGNGGAGGASTLFGLSAAGGAGGTRTTTNGGGAAGVAYSSITGTAYQYSGGGGDGRVINGGGFGGGASGGGIGGTIKGTGGVMNVAGAGAANSGGGGGGGVRSTNGATNGAGGGSGVVFTHFYGDSAAVGGGALTTIDAATSNYNRKFTAGGTLTTSTAAVNQVAIFSGDITGASGLVLGGPGTLVLSGVNSSYEAGTTVNAGKLVVGSNNALGTGGVALNALGTMQIQAGFAPSNLITIATGGRLIADTGSSAVIKSGTSFVGWESTSTAPDAKNTLAQLLYGTAGGDRTISPSSWSDMISGQTYSDVLNLTGTAGDTYVLQMSYNLADLGAQPESNLLLGWLNGGTWENAGTGSTNLGAYTGQTTLGEWGVDTSLHKAWAVVDHNSEFAVVALVPEPASIVLLAAGLLGLLAYAWRKRK